MYEQEYNKSLLRISYKQRYDICVKAIEQELDEGKATYRRLESPLIPMIAFPLSEVAKLQGRNESLPQVSPLSVIKVTCQDIFFHRKRQNYRHLLKLVYLLYY